MFKEFIEALEHVSPIVWGYWAYNLSWEQDPTKAVLWVKLTAGNYATATSVTDTQLLGQVQKVEEYAKQVVNDMILQLQKIAPPAKYSLGVDAGYTWTGSKDYQYYGQGANSGVLGSVNVYGGALKPTKPSKTSEEVMAEREAAMPESFEELYERQWEQILENSEKAKKIYKNPLAAKLKAKQQTAAEKQKQMEEKEQFAKQMKELNETTLKYMLQELVYMTSPQEAKAYGEALVAKVYGKLLEPQPAKEGEGAELKDGLYWFGWDGVEKTEKP